MGSELNGMEPTAMVVDEIFQQFGVSRRTLSADGCDRHAMRLALFASSLSCDPSTRVGAVIVNASGRVIGSGYNRVPAGITPTDRDHRLACTIHAETNAILSTRSPNLRGATIYITHPPCCNCAALIANVGIKRVVHLAPSPEFAERWYVSLGQAQSLLANLGIVREQMDA